MVSSDSEALILRLDIVAVETFLAKSLGSDTVIVDEALVDEFVGQVHG